MTLVEKDFERFQQKELNIEILRLGRHTLLHSRDSNAIVLTREFEAKCWPDLFSQLSQAELSQLEEWERAGLFNPKPYFPEEVVVRKYFFPKKIFIFRSIEGAIKIRLNDETLINQICCILEDYLGSSDILTDRTLVVEGDDQGFTVFENGDPVTERHGRDEIRFFLIKSICETVLGHEHVAATLHGSAIAFADRALLFIGASGSGKTTTALGLLREGAQQVADDHIALCSSGRNVLAFPTAIGLKPGMWSSPLGKGLMSPLSYTAFTRAGVRYVKAPLSAAPGQPFEVSASVFPHYDPEADFSIERITAEEGFVMSIVSGGRIVRRHNSAAPLADFFNSTPAYRVTYSNSDQILPAMKALIST